MAVKINMERYTTMAVDADANEYGRGPDLDSFAAARQCAAEEWPDLIAECPEIARIDIWTVDEFGGRLDIVDSYTGPRSQ